MSIGRYWADTILVNAKTGEYFFASEYLRSHSDKELFHELAYGNFVHEEKWNGKNKERNNEQQNIS